MTRSSRFSLVLAASLVAACSSENGPSNHSTGTASSASESETGTTGTTGTGTSEDTGTPFDGTFEFEEIDIEGDFYVATALRFIEGTNEFLMLSKHGTVGHFSLDGDSAELLGEFIVPNVYSDLDCGLISIAFDPDFATNQFIYVGVCTSMQDSQIQRLTFDPQNYDLITDSSAEIISLGDPSAPRPWHNVGEIGFDGDGNMWALFGDKRVDGNGQDTSKALASLIRIVPNRDPGGFGYTIVQDNPFVGDDTKAPEIYAYGFRSPWQGVLDSRGRYWIGEVGRHTVDEVNVVTEPAQNFGWATFEGPCFEDCDGFTNPITYWRHGEIEDYQKEDDQALATQRRVVWVGPEYRDLGNDRYDGRLTDRVLFGDRCVGFVRALGLDDQNNVVFDQHLGHIEDVTDWAQGPDGYLYTISFGQCESIDTEPGNAPESKLYRAVMSD